MLGEKSNSAPIGFEKVLSGHGYPFQYRVLAEAKLEFENQRSRWMFESAEHPVQVRGWDGRVDFVLRHADHTSPTLIMAAECKRADPKRSAWCFYRTPFRFRDDEGHKELLFDTVDLSTSVPWLSPHRVDTDARIAHQGIVMRSQGGDSSKQGGDHPEGRSLEDAIAQCFRGASGLLVEQAGRGRNANSEDAVTAVIPVIFTTASLWLAGDALEKASLEEGALPCSSMPLTRAPWLWLHYHRGPELGPEFRNRHTPQTFAEALRFTYSRSIAIVSSAGIAEFLSWRPGADWALLRPIAPVPR